MKCIALCSERRVYGICAKTEEVDVCAKLTQCSAQRHKIKIVRVEEQPIELAGSSQLKCVTANLRVDRLFTSVEAFANGLWRVMLVKPLSCAFELLDSLTAVLDTNVGYQSRLREIRQKNETS